MARGKSGNLAVFILLVIMAGWSLYQFYGLIHPKSEKQDAARLLYQVSLFQMELLGSFLNEAGHASQTSDLDSLNQSVYSANYTHQRLVLAMGESKLAPLQSIGQLMQFIMRLRIGGERPLKTDEVETIREVSVKFKEFYAVYEQLMSSGSGIVDSNNEKLIKLDAEISAYIQGKLFQ
jgi:hypothetical protein